MTHRFAEARSYLAQIEAAGPLGADANRLSLSIDQACGSRLERVLEVRRQMAAAVWAFGGSGAAWGFTR